MINCSSRIGPTQKLVHFFQIHVVFCCMFCAYSVAATPPKIPRQIVPHTLTLKSAVESTLLLDPDILLEQEQQNVQLGNFLSDFGFFDTVFNWNIAGNHDYVPLQEYLQIIPEIDTQNTDLGVFNMGLSKTFQNGVNINSNINMLRQQNNITRKLYVPIQNQSYVNFNLNVPFFQGSMVGLTARAAYLSYLSERYTYAHTISKSVLESILLYWSYVASYQSLNVLEEAISQDKMIADAIKEMVDKGEQTKSELSLAHANLAARKAAYYAMREQYIQNKQFLATSMGIRTEDIHLLKPPSTHFPKGRDTKVTQQALPKFFENMMHFRNDLKADVFLIKANFTLLKMQQTNLGPQFDGNGSIGYRGLHEGTNAVRSISDHMRGPVATVGLTYTFPIQNNTARGNLMSQSAVYTQSKITYNNLLRTIKVNLITAYNSVNLFNTQLRYNKNAVGNYEETLRNEFIKLKLGESSLLDVLQIKNYLVQTQLDEIASQSGYAQALAQLYYEQGLFICYDHIHCKIDLKAIS